MDLEAKLAGAGIRPARSEEDLDRAEAFLRTPRVREIVAGHPDERGCVRLCETESGDLLAALLFDPSPLRIRETDVRCARILETGGEDGRAYFRRTGDRELFDFVLEELLGYLWARRYPIAFVHGELALFPAHGFAPCFYHPRVYLDVATALRLPSPYRIRHLKSDDAAAIVTLREHNRRFRPTVYAAGVPLFHHFCVEDADRRVRGYFSLELDEKRRTFMAPEVEAVDHPAACTILRHFAEKAAALGLPEFHFPLAMGHPIANLCLEIGGRAVVRGATNERFLDEELLLLSDPVGVCDALGPYFERRLARAGATDVRATIAIATERGCWEIRVEDGRVGCAPTTRAPERCIEMPHWALTQILAGYRSVRDLDTEMDDEQRELLRLLLPKTWPYSMPDAEHWEEGSSPQPYSDAAAEVVRSVRLPWSATP